MDTETILEEVDAQPWLDAPAEELQKAVSSGFEAGGPACKAIKNCMHGTWLGHPLHAALTDVPIGAYCVAGILDTMEAFGGQRAAGRGADAAIGVGLIGALCSASTGIVDWSVTDGRARKVGLVHGALNGTATLLYAMSWMLRRAGGSRATARGFGFTGLALTTAAAWLGGALVYSEKIGVDHADRALPEEWTPLMPLDDVPDNKLLRAEAQGHKFVLLRRGEEIFALGEVCAHLGGPLAEGELGDDPNGGPSVRCPWHGSCFALRDGAVLEGPATHPQPALEARVREGRVEVRLKAMAEA